MAKLHDAAAEIFASASREIAALREENAALKIALAPLANAENSCDCHFSADTNLTYLLSGENITLGDIRRARAAIGRS